MTVTLYVWPRRGSNVGHASVQVAQTYASYWPVSATGKADFKKGAVHPASYPREYRTDVRLEKCIASWVLTFSDMDEATMIAMWQEIRLRGSKYNMVKHNCSSVVAALLQAGSGISPPFVPRVRISDIGLPLHVKLSMQLRFLGDTIRMWSPEAVAE